VASKRSSSSFRIYSVAAAAGAAVALVDYLFGLWMAAHGLHAEATLLDEFLLAIFTGAFVFVIEWSHQRDQERMNEKLKTIEANESSRPQRASDHCYFGLRSRPRPAGG
jgi:hypothetical protein